MPNNDVTVDVDDYIMLGEVHSGALTTTIFLHFTHAAHDERTLLGKCAAVYGFGLDTGAMTKGGAIVVLDVNESTVHPVHVTHASKARLIPAPSRRILMSALKDGFDEIRANTTSGTVLRCIRGAITVLELPLLEISAAVDHETVDWAPTVRISVGATESDQEVDIGPEKFLSLTTLRGVAIFLHLYTKSRDVEQTAEMCRSVRRHLIAARHLPAEVPCLMFNWYLASTPSDPDDYAIFPVLISSEETPHTIDDLKALFHEATAACHAEGRPAGITAIHCDANNASYTVINEAIAVRQNVLDHLVRMRALIRTPPE
jgi:hypothetical protein